MAKAKALAESTLTLVETCRRGRGKENGKSTSRVRVPKWKNPQALAGRGGGGVEVVVGRSAKPRILPTGQSALRAHRSTRSRRPA